MVTFRSLREASEAKVPKAAEPVKIVEKVVVPLHLKPEDTSRFAFAQRIDLYQRAYAMNPSGFRQPAGQSQRRRRPHLRPTPITRMQDLGIQAGVVSLDVLLKREESERGVNKRKFRKLHVLNVKSQIGLPLNHADRRRQAQMQALAAQARRAAQ